MWGVSVYFWASGKSNSNPSNCAPIFVSVAQDLIKKFHCTCMCFKCFFKKLVRIINNNEKNIIIMKITDF